MSATEAKNYGLIDQVISRQNLPKAGETVTTVKKVCQYDSHLKCSFCGKSQEQVRVDCRSESTSAMSALTYVMKF